MAPYEPIRWSVQLRPHLPYVSERAEVIHDEDWFGLSYWRFVYYWSFFFSYFFSYFFQIGKVRCFRLRKIRWCFRLREASRRFRLRKAWCCCCCFGTSGSRNEALVGSRCSRIFLYHWPMREELPLGSKLQLVVLRRMLEMFIDSYFDKQMKRCPGS